MVQPTVQMASDSRFQRVEQRVLEVYNHCPPTFTRYSASGWEQYERQWEWFMGQLGLHRVDFADKRLLDVGCGSCEKASFYSDWGARVTGLEMTPSVIERACQVIGSRPIEIICGSIFTARLDRQFDIVVADGVLHHTADTWKALAKCLEYLKEDGILILGLVNVWGSFWWFSVARALTSLLGGRDFHRRARWGRLLFQWTRQGHEGTEDRSGGYFRSIDSWAYDWFGNPRWNRHSPSVIARRLADLSLQHMNSVPPLVGKGPSRTLGARILRALTGPRQAGMNLYWLFNAEPNMLYVCARKGPGASAGLPSGFTAAT
jgi:SAM-dependent methyltransferase